MYSALQLCRLVFLRLVITGGLLLHPRFVRSQPVFWTGVSENGLWNDASNWSENSVPGPAAMVILDNSAIPGTYRVQLPDVPVTLQSIAIRPSPGNSIELLLPVSDTSNDALMLTGTGYPLLLGEGAVFRNASGVSSGASIGLADSFRIENGGRYIHGTRGTHASSLLAKLSSAPGTERGIFEFDVPRASYTISVSNRTYGTLALRSSAHGQTVNYTCSGSNPLHIRGDLDLGINVQFSVDLATAKGNIAVDGDFLQQPGTFNLGSGAGDSTILGVGGRFIQQSGALLTSAATAFPWVELNGTAAQLFSPGGEITGNTGVRIRNGSGVELQHQLTLSSFLELAGGVLRTTDAALLTLGASCVLIADSLRKESFIDGPLKRQLNPETPAALFPVGAGGALRWLEMKEASGIFTAAYFSQNPGSLSGQMGAGIHHISSREYWYLQTDGAAIGKVELSHSVPQSGDITEPSVLRVAQLLGTDWKDDGLSAFTGDLLRGSVISFPLADFSGIYFTMGSALPLENPLPLESVSLTANRKDGRILFHWTVHSPETPSGFELIFAGKLGEQKLLWKEAVSGQTEYGCSLPDTLSDPFAQPWRIDLIDRQGKRVRGETVLLAARPVTQPLLYVARAGRNGRQTMMLRSARAGSCFFTLYSVTGKNIFTGTWSYGAGDNRKELFFPFLPGGLYFFRVNFTEGGEKTLRLLL